MWQRHTSDGGEQRLRGRQLPRGAVGAPVVRLHQEVGAGAAHHRAAVATHDLQGKFYTAKLVYVCIILSHSIMPVLRLRSLSLLC